MLDNLGQILLNDVAVSRFEKSREQIEWLGASNQVLLHSTFHYHKVLPIYWKLIWKERLKDLLNIKKLTFSALWGMYVLL